MMQGIRRRLSFANITSMMALMVALGGTAYAATLPRNSVGTAQIKSRAVKNADLGDSAVTSGKVRNSSLQARDFAPGQLPAGAPGARGLTGLQGPPGLQGIQGLQGPTGLLGSVIVRRTDVPLPQAGTPVPGPITSGFAACQPGEQIIGGSANVSNITAMTTMELLADRPSVDNVGNGTVPSNGGSFTFWKGTGRMLTNGVDPASLRVFAFCATP